MDVAAAPNTHVSPALTLKPADFTDARLLDLLRWHLESARAATAAGCAHALDATGLQAPDIEVWTLWEGETLLGVGALKRLDAHEGEIKSMHVAASSRRNGAGSHLLRHILAAARGHGLTRVSLETGSWDYFAPARALYAKHGFVPCGPFGSYRLDPNSVFMTRALDETA